MLRVDELQIEQFGKFESRIFTREIKKHQNKGFLTGPLSSDNFNEILKKRTPSNSLKIANGEKELVTKKVGFSSIGSSCNFDLHVFEQNN